MKKIIIILFFLTFGISSFVFGATVGGPDMSIPDESLFLKDQAIKKSLDRLETEMNIKVGLDMEIVTKRKLSSAADVTDAELSGSNFMFKISDSYKELIETYIKIGTSSLEVEWSQNNDKVKVESDIGIAWAAGAKAKLWTLKNYNVDLTMDLQYRHTSLGFDKAKINGSVSAASRINEDFTISEWQTSLLASKKYIIPLGVNDCYVIPYGGLTYLASDVDLSFTRSTSGQLYSLYNADDENDFGVVLGCDIMPFYLSYYLLNFELRLLNETALTLGGTVKF